MIPLSLESINQPIDGRYLDTLIDHYLQDKAMTTSKTTVTNYRHQLVPFRLWWSEFGTAGGHVLRKTDLDMFRRWLDTDYRDTRGHQPAPSTVHTICTRVRMYLRWLHTSGRLPVDVSSWMPVPSKPRPAQRFLTLPECQRLFDACRGILRTRDQAMLALLLGTGARRFEAAEALRANLSFADDLSGTLYLEKVKFDADGRKGAGRLVFFDSAVGIPLRVHLAASHDPDEPRILGMTNSAIRARIDVLSKRAGVEVSSHDFRRTFSDYWMDNGPADADFKMTMLRMQLGHSLPTDDTTSRHYLDLRNRTKLEARLRQAYSSPVGEMWFPEW